jgi:hypothetical protein
MIEALLDKVIRVQTDNVTLTHKHAFGKIAYKPIAEDKTTGPLIWYNCNSNNRSRQLLEEKKARCSVVRNGLLKK